MARSSPDAASTPAGQRPPAAGARYPDLAGKVVLVTGGAGGIGEPLCRTLAAQGARVAVVSRSEAAAVGVASELGPTALAVAADCTLPDQVAAMCQRVASELGPPDGVVCLAGGALVGAAPTHLITPDQWDEVLSSNLSATFLTIRGVLPLMIARRRGAIVTAASAAARVPTAATAAYAVAKAGVIALTRHVALEAARYGIRVNCVSPSVIVTRTNEPAAELREALTGQHPLGRLGEASDVASAVLFLLSEASEWITGVTLDVAGGRVTVLCEKRIAQKRAPRGTVAQQIPHRRWAATCPAFSET